MDTIEWPNESRIVTKNVKDATLVYTQNLFYNTGLLVSVIYLALKLVLVPCLDQQCSQRIEISATTLLRLRKAVSRLQNSIKTTPIAVIGYNESDNSIERCTQTSENENKQSERSWSLINRRLIDSTTHLGQFVQSNSRESKSLDAFNMEAKLLSDKFRLEASAESQSELNKKMVKSIREVKGWFVSGRIH